MVFQGNDGVGFFLLFIKTPGFLQQMCWRLLAPYTKYFILEASEVVICHMLIDLSMVDGQLLAKLLKTVEITV